MVNLEICREAGTKAAQDWLRARRKITLDDHKLDRLFEFERDIVTTADRMQRLKCRNAFLAGFNDAEREVRHAQD